MSEHMTRRKPYHAVAHGDSDAPIANKPVGPYGEPLKRFLTDTPEDLPHRGEKDGDVHIRTRASWILWYTTEQEFAQFTAGVLSQDDLFKRAALREAEVLQWAKKAGWWL